MACMVWQLKKREEGKTAQTKMKGCMLLSALHGCSFPTTCQLTHHLHTIRQLAAYGHCMGGPTGCSSLPKYAHKMQKRSCEQGMGGFKSLK
eukprot:1139381-Pelagomonas_calceolata.AAC.3